MKILIACEFSGIIRDAFIKKGHDAISCDFLPTEVEGPHLQCNVLTLLEDNWDMMVAFPDCTYLCSSGLHWNRRRPERAAKTEDAVKFFLKLWNAPINKIAIENPIGCMSTRLRKPDQIIQPYQYGENASKSTCLWLKNLPLLTPTKYIEPRIVNGKKRWANQTDSGQNKLAPSDNRWKDRARTYKGIAQAIAEQWS